mgnify:CR=1 FL=1
MALSLNSISKKTAVRAPRILLTGREKIGKTTCASGCSFEDGKLVRQGANKPIVLPMKGEEGVDGLDVPSFPTLGSVEEVLQALEALCTEDHDYRTVVIDSASALEPLVWDYLCRRENVEGIEKVGGGYGKGYTEAAGVWREILAGLDALRAAKNMATVIIGHVRCKRFDDPTGASYDQYQLDMHEKSSAVLQRWADLILFATTKVAVKKEDQGFGKKKKRGVDVTGGQRFLFTQQRPGHPGGGRDVYGRLPYELPLNYSAFEAAVTDAMTNKETT